MTANEIYSADDIGRAANVATSEVERRLSASGVTRIDGYVGQGDAVRLVRALASGQPVAPEHRQPLTLLEGQKRRSTAGLIASSALHASMVMLLVIVSLGLLSASTTDEVVVDKTPTRLVYLMTPGPGGGGGGGGLKNPIPPPRAQKKSIVKRTPSSPVPEVRKVVPPPPKPIEPPPVVQPKIEPPPITPAPPAVNAPVATVPADPVDTIGLPTAPPAPPSTSQGSGTGGGVGSGAGTGLGEGRGNGLGDGSGGGTGGGPYRPGAGIEPPTLVREVKATYTDEGRRRGIQGAVLLEIVVRRDGSVGAIRVMRGLGAGLDQRAIDAVSQWRFGPARRHGTPVDVIVEVAVEFKLR